MQNEESSEYLRRFCDLESECPCIECRAWYKVVLDTWQGECSGEASRYKGLLQLIVSSHFAWALRVALGT